MNQRTVVFACPTICLGNRRWWEKLSVEGLAQSWSLFQDASSLGKSFSNPLQLSCWGMEGTEFCLSPAVDSEWGIQVSECGHLWGLCLNPSQLSGALHEVSRDKQTVRIWFILWCSGSLTQGRVGEWLPHWDGQWEHKVWAVFGFFVSFLLQDQHTGFVTNLGTFLRSFIQRCGYAQRDGWAKTVARDSCPYSTLPLMCWEAYTPLFAVLGCFLWSCFCFHMQMAGGMLHHSKVTQYMGCHSRQIPASTAVAMVFGHTWDMVWRLCGASA